MIADLDTLRGLRIGIVTPTLARIGGTEIYVERLVGVQRGLGAVTSAFTAEESESGQGDVPEHPLGSALSESINPLTRPNRAAVNRAADLIAARCDIVEFHRCAPLPLMRALRGRVPMALYAHTADLTCPAGGRYLPRSNSVCGRAPGVVCLAVHASQSCLTAADGTRFPLLQKLRAPLRGRISRAAMRMAGAMVFNSRALEELFSRTVGIPDRSSVLPPPLAEAPVVGGMVRVPSRLLFCGRLHRVKGVLDAIEVAERIGAELVIVGTGVQEGEARVRAESPGVRGRVHFRGWLGADDVAREMAQAQCLLMPSRWFEAWGMVGPEAVLQGCAVVAYDSGGVREWCREPWGSLVARGDVAALAQAARQVLEHPATDEQSAAWREAALREWGEAVFSSAYRQIVATLAPRNAR